jgi:hypothetical protein
MDQEHLFTTTVYWTAQMIQAGFVILCLGSAVKLWRERTRWAVMQFVGLGITAATAVAQLTMERIYNAIFGPPIESYVSIPMQVAALFNVLKGVGIATFCVAYFLTAIREQRGSPNHTHDGIRQPANGSPKPSV